jgi:hypothetical protein
MIIELTLLLAAGLGNAAWDVTGRRVSARARRRARRARRSGQLPQGGIESEGPESLRALEGLAPLEFLELTLRSAEELDSVVDHFDLVLLRAEAAERLVEDIVYVGAQAPRARGHEVIAAWLAAVDALEPGLVERLRELGLPDRALRELVLRERWHAGQDVDKRVDPLARSAGEFEAAHVLLGTFLRTLSSSRHGPYR